MKKITSLITVLMIVNFASILFFGIFTVYTKKAFLEEKEFNSIKRQLDSLKIEHRVLEKEYKRLLNELKQDSLLVDPVQLLLRLERDSIPFAKEWVKVSIMEVGDRSKPLSSFKCAHVTKYNNLFCWHKIRHPLMKKVVNPAGEPIAMFASKGDCLLFLKWWINFSPPKSKESFTDFLKRRCFNTNPNYFIYLNRIRL